MASLKQWKTLPIHNPPPSFYFNRDYVFAYKGAWDCHHQPVRQCCGAGSGQRSPGGRDPACLQSKLNVASIRLRRRLGQHLGSPCKYSSRLCSHENILLPVTFCFTFWEMIKRATTLWKEADKYTCQRSMSGFYVTQHIHEIINLWKFGLNLLCE